MASNENERKSQPEVLAGPMKASDKFGSAKSKVYGHYGVNGTNTYHKLRDMAIYYDKNGVIKDPIEKARLQRTLNKKKNALIEQTQKYKHNKAELTKIVHNTTHDATKLKQKLEKDMGHFYKRIIDEVKASIPPNYKIITIIGYCFMITFSRQRFDIHCP
jgi:hypothetical protein